MGLSAEKLREDLDALAARDPRVAAQIARIGYPEPRLRDRGFVTMLRTIVGQQVSVAAAASMWRKLEAELGSESGGAFTPGCLLKRDFDTLRACGLSRQKQGYARSLCELVEAGELDFEGLPADDEEAIALLTRIKGIGRWSAEIYLLFAEGRADVFPAGDLALQVQLGRLLGEEARPTEKRARALAEPMRPHRGALSIFLWHNYNIVAL